MLSPEHGPGREDQDGRAAAPMIPPLRSDAGGTRDGATRIAAPARGSGTSGDGQIAVERPGGTPLPAVPLGDDQIAAERRGDARPTAVLLGEGQIATERPGDGRPIALEKALPPGAGQPGGRPFWRPRVLGGWPGSALRGGYRGDPAAWLIAGGVFALYATLTLLLYEHFAPASWDLGIFTEYVRQYANLHAPIVNISAPGSDLLGDHFHPIVALIAPFFRLFPTPATLLVAQALLVAVSVVPVCRAGRELLGTAESRAIGAAYGLSWGLQQLIRYDFHEVAFAVPLLAFSLSALIRGRYRAAVAWALPLVFVKEDQGLTVAAIGLLLAWRYRRPIAGALLAGWGIGWSLLAIFVIIPHFNQQHSYPYWAKGGVLSPGTSVTLGAVTHQLVAGASVKLPTLALILLAAAFLAVRSPLVLVALAGVALRFVSVNPIYWGTSWHYNATVMPVIFVAAIDAMAALRLARADPAWISAQVRWPVRSVRRLAAALERNGAALMIGVSVALLFQFPLSELWSPGTYQVGARTAAVRAALAKVPDGVTVATDLNLLAPLAARDDTYWLGSQGQTATQYVVFDTTSSDYQPPPGDVLAFVDGLHPGVGYRQIFAAGSIYVFRKTAPG